MAHTLLEVIAVEKSITIWAAGKAVGQVVDGVFVKHVQASKHFLQKPPGICLDAQSLADAQRAGARVVRIEDSETGRVYRADISTIRKWGKTLDRGHGAQLALSLGKWTVDDPTVTHRQLDLFGMAGVLL